MNQLNTKILKKTIAGAGLLATAPVWAQGTSEGSKSQIGVNHLSLEESPGRNVILCADPDQVGSKTGGDFIPNEITVAVNPFAHSFFEAIFTVREILAQDEDHVLFLVYSRSLLPSPAMPTPNSEKKLMLDMSDLEILAMYNIPAQQLIAAQPTRLGTAQPKPGSAVSFRFNFSTKELPFFISDNEKVYLQAAFMKKSHFDAEAFDRLILSEVDTINFKEMTCPEGAGSIGMDSDGTLTTTSASGNTTKIQETSSVTSSSASVTKAGSSTTTGGEGGSSGGGGGK